MQAVRLLSEDPGTKGQDGLMGLVTRADERVPAEIRQAVFDRPYPDTPLESAQGRLVGPVRIQQGAVLLWLGARRPQPGWEEMSRHVHRELRQRFMDEVLPESEVWTWLDG